MNAQLEGLRGDWRTEAVEDFLKTVYLLEQQVAPVPTTLLARALNKAAPSVTDMIKRLSIVEEEARDRKDPRRDVMPQLLDYEPYRGVRLTEEGRRIALEVVRHHRLLEVYLIRVLGYSWDEVHEEADRLEHYISEKLEQRIADALGNPALDPHGDPIPAIDGTIQTPALIFLSDLASGRQGEVSRVVDQAPEVLRYLSDLELTPGAHIEVMEHAPLHDTVSLRLLTGAEEITISTQVARKILVLVSESGEQPGQPA